MSGLRCAEVLGAGELGRGTLRVKFPGTTGEVLAEACAPLVGVVFGSVSSVAMFLPPKGSQVWIFEGERPGEYVWMGCAWPPDAVVSPDLANQMTALKAETGGLRGLVWSSGHSVKVTEGGTSVSGASTSVVSINLAGSVLSVKPNQIELDATFIRLNQENLVVTK